MMAKENNPAYMREYLRYAIEFERYVYVWSQAMDEVNGRMSRVYQERKQLEGLKVSTNNTIGSLDTVNERKLRRAKDDVSRYKKKTKNIITAMFVIQIILFIFGCILGSAVANSPEAKFEASNAVYSLILGISVLVIGSFWVLPVCIGKIIYNKNKIRELESESSQLSSGSSVRRQEVLLKERAKQTEESLSNNYAQETTIIQRQEEIYVALSNAKNTLANIYSENVLPIKYRSFNAVATLYEYLATGRCNTVQGHGGIYDTYENDLKMGIIISTLSEIRDSMYRIEANQQLLYNEMQKANSTLTSIKNCLGDIKKINTQIAKNTAISAAANQQTAAAAQWMAWNGVHVY